MTTRKRKRKEKEKGYQYHSSLYTTPLLESLASTHSSHLSLPVEFSRNDEKRPGHVSRERAGYFEEGFAGDNFSSSLLDSTSTDCLLRCLIAQHSSRVQSASYGTHLRRQAHSLNASLSSNRKDSTNTRSNKHSLQRMVVLSCLNNSSLEGGEEWEGWGESLNEIGEIGSSCPSSEAESDG